MHIWSSVIAQIRKEKGKWDLIAEEKILLGVDLAVWWSPFLLPNLWCFVWDSFPWWSWWSWWSRGSCWWIGCGGHGSSLLFFNLSFTDWKEISCKPGWWREKLALKSLTCEHYVITKMNMTTKLMLVMHCEDVSGISFMAGEQHSGGRGGQFIITRPLFCPCIGKRWNIEIKSKSCRFGGGNNINITATVRCIWRVSWYLRYRGVRG